MSKPCKDCVADLLNVEPKSGWRPAPHPGPRCATHHRAWRRRAQNLAHGRRIESDYQITAEDYWELYRAQGGVCFICRVATGKSKRLAVEHEHGLCDDHPPEKGCRRCIRGLTCARCNRLVAFLGIEALSRAIQLLANPPARKVLAHVAADVNGRSADALTALASGANINR